MSKNVSTEEGLKSGAAGGVGKGGGLVPES